MTKNFAPAADRNKDVIADSLVDLLSDGGVVLEVASGTGQHAVHFARRFPQLQWQPSDADPAQVASVRAYRAEAGLDNVLEPVLLDATSDPWPVDRADAVFNANMIHIAPWAVCLGLLSGAARLLEPGAPLITYGPYRVDGHMVESNQRFDRMLASMDPEFGVRELRDVEREAGDRGLVLDRTVEMPANNLLVVWRRQ